MTAFDSWRCAEGKKLMTSITPANHFSDWLHIGAIIPKACMDDGLGVDLKV